MLQVSIITTTYKHQNFIKDTIESILSQTFSNRELLIGDDSPDNETWKIIQKYVKKYPDKIKAWHHKTNKGIVDNMNFLLEQTSTDSKYVAFLEGDDMYTNDNLEKKINIFNQHPAVKLVYSNTVRINNQNIPINNDFYNKQHIPFIQNKKVTKKQYILHNASYLVSRSNIMIKKEILNNVGIKNIGGTKNYGGSDYDFGFNVMTNYCVYGVKEPLRYYRKHDNNISNNFIDMLETTKRIMTYYLNKKQIGEDLYQRKIKKINNLYVLYYLYQKDIRKIKENKDKVSGIFILILYLPKFILLFIVNLYKKFIS